MGLFQRLFRAALKAIALADQSLMGAAPVLSRL
jgi:hypothetical protein